MSEKNPEIGSISWFDLTVPNAEQVRDFYSKVVGWRPSAVSMGDYDDYTMNAPDSGNGVAGVCHSRGGNVGLPAQWLIYITVENVDESAKQCVELGGKIMMEPKDMSGYGRYCIIQDPAGAVAALFAPKS